MAPLASPTPAMPTSLGNSREMSFTLLQVSPNIKLAAKILKAIHTQESKNAAVTV